MPRDHARLLCRIWEDDDFVSLDELSQRLYLLLISQRTVSHAGVMPLQVSKWAKRGPRKSQDGVLIALRDLSENGYVIVDEYTEELLIRSYLRNDGVLTQPNMVKAALRASAAIESPKLRHALADELERLDEDLGRLPRGDVQAEARATVATLRGSGPPPQDPQSAPEHGPSDAVGSPSVSPNGVQQTGQDVSPVKANRGPREGLLVRGKGLGVGVGTNSTLKIKDKDTIKSEDLITHEPDHDPPLLELVHPRPTMPSSADRDAAFVRFWTAYPRKVAKKKARTAWDNALKEVDEDTIVVAVKRYAKHCDPKFIKHPATWLNGGCWDDEPPPRNLAAVSNGYRPYQDPTDQTVYQGRL